MKSLPRADEIRSGKDSRSLRKVDGRWRWHPDYCSEFMVADDFAISETVGIDFVLHIEILPNWVMGLHRTGRPIASPQATSGKLLAYIRARGVRDLDKHLAPDAGIVSWTWRVPGFGPY